MKVFEDVFSNFYFSETKFKFTAGSILNIKF